ncbi:MAG: hypothetical protein ABSB79_07400 [Syntrophales bacterium]|jgi:hypothetical protein
MAAQIIIDNISRTYEYVVIINGNEISRVFPLKTVDFTVSPGHHEITFRDSDSEADLPSSCKPICFEIADNKILHLQIDTKNLVIWITDTVGTHLNGQHGFLCGKVSGGVYVENPIT